MEDQRSHKLILTDRNHLTVTAVTEVVRFEDTAAVLQTGQGTLILQGEQLQLKSLSRDGGEVEVEGTVTALAYEEARSAGSWKRRLFG